MEITFLKGYEVRATQLIDEKTSTYRQVFYGKPDENLVVEMKNGHYDGKGILRKNGVIRMIYTFTPKKTENKVLVFSHRGEIIFNGYETNNLKTGFCIEYVNGNVRFIGMYSNGMRNGYGCSYNERGSVEFRGRWKDNEKTNSSCDEDSFLNSIKPEIIESKSNNEMAVFPISTEFIIVIAALALISIILVFIFLFTIIPRSTRITLSNGCIWMGYVKLSLPNGNGKYYHSNGTLYYQGNCLNGYFNGNGIMYHPDGKTKHFEGIWEHGYLTNGTMYTNEGALEYEGEFLNNIPHGIGRRWQNQSVVFEGIWNHGYDYRGKYNSSEHVYFEKKKQEFGEILQIHSAADTQKCSFKIKTVVIQDGAFNAKGDTEFNVANCINVEEMLIGNKCGKFVTSFTVAHLPRLKSVVIGEDSFTQFAHTDEQLKYNIPRIVDEKRTFLISNCSQLETITIDSRSFSDFFIFKLEGLNSHLIG